jgi:hypothetical protein
VRLRWVHPKRERIVGGAGRLVTVAEVVSPRRFEGVNRRYVNRLQFAAEPAPVSYTHQTLPTKLEE